MGEGSVCDSTYGPDCGPCSCDGPDSSDESSEEGSADDFTPWRDGIACDFAIGEIDEGYMLQGIDDVEDLREG